MSDMQYIYLCIYIVYANRVLCPVDLECREFKQIYTWKRVCVYALYLVAGNQHVILKCRLNSRLYKKRSNNKGKSNWIYVLYTYWLSFLVCLGWFWWWVVFDTRDCWYSRCDTINTTCLFCLFIACIYALRITNTLPDRDLSLWSHRRIPAQA